MKLIAKPSTLCKHFACEIKLHGEWRPIPLVGSNGEKNNLKINYN
jgi:hypothetical protein